MKYLAFPFLILPVPALAHEAGIAHSHAFDYLAPAFAGLLVIVSLGLAVQRLARIRT